MSTLHDAARRVVAAWTSTRPAWIEQCNEAVLALDAALKAETAQEPITRIFGTLPVHDAQQPEPAQEPVEWLAKWANAYTGKAYTDWQKGYDDARSVVKAYLTGNHTHSQEPEHPEPAGCETEADCTSQPWCRISGECHRKQPEPAQEPVAWMVYTLDGKSVCVTDNPADFTDEHKALPLYATPQPETAQEPVAWRTFDGEGGYDYRTYDENENYAEEWAKRNPRHVGWVEPLYTAPQPQRPPLTDEEIDRLWHDNGAGIDDERFSRIARAIERKVRGEA